LGKIENSGLSSFTFVPEFSTNKSSVNIPYVFPFREVILQAAIRHNLCDGEKLQKFLEDISVNEVKAEDLEVLGEKALPVGHIDIFIKERVPIGESRNIMIEVKAGKATKRSFEQLEEYLRESGSECLRAVLIAKDFVGKKTWFSDRIIPLRYEISCDLSIPKSFQELTKCMEFEKP
jgi:hypothetical protein